MYDREIISVVVVIVILGVYFGLKHEPQHKIVNIHQLPGYTVRRPSRTVLSNAGFKVVDDYSTKQTLPAEVENHFTEWIDKGFVSIVKDQMHCGGCWAFATAGTISDRLAIVTNGKWVCRFGISEQYLLSCERNLGGCDGGLPAEAFKQMNTKGLPENVYDKESPVNFTYYQTITDGGMSCSLDSNHNTCTCEDVSEKFPAKILYKTVGDPHVLSQHSENPNEIIDNDLWKDIPQNVIDDNVLRMKKAIYFSGPITIGIKVMPSFYQFVPTSENFYKYTGDGNEQFEGHALTLVGWKKLKDGTPVWIVKNSWGENWGYGFDEPLFDNVLSGKKEKKYKGGFFNMIMGQNNCYIESNACGAHPDLSVVQQFLPAGFTATPDYYLKNCLREILEKHPDYKPVAQPAKEDHKPTPPDTPKYSVWEMVLIALVILIILINVGFVVYYYFRSSSET